MKPQSRDDIQRRLVEILARDLGVDASQAAPEASLTDDFQLDSLDVIAVVNRLEEIYGIQVPDSRIGEIRTLESCVEAVTRGLPSPV